MQELFAETERGSILNGVLFSDKKSDTVLIAITGIHGNFYSNPFYFNIGETLCKNGIDFIYAQTNDAFGEIETFNVKTQEKEIIGSHNERFFYTEEDIFAYLNFAEKNYKNIFLAGHSLGANKVIYFLSKNPDANIKKFLLLSPANLSYMMSGVTDYEKKIIKKYVEYWQGEKILPFEFMGWVVCTANTAADWLSGILDNTTQNFTQVEKINHSGALVIGTYDNFTRGDPKNFLENINKHFREPEKNELIFIEKTGHTYQQKEQEIADIILKYLRKNI